MKQEEPVRKVRCPHCGQISSYKVPASINGTLQPLLRQAILEETLFDWQCPHCEGQARLFYPFVYHDMRRRLLIDLAAGSRQASVDAAALSNTFPALEQYTTRWVRSLTALKEKILIFERGLDDGAMELTKLALMQMVQRREHCSLKAGYWEASQKAQAQDRLFFAFLTPEGEVLRRSVHRSAYEKSLEIARHFPTLAAGFPLVSKRWAVAVMQEYRATQDSGKQA